MPTRHARITPQSSHGQLAAALAALREQFSVNASFPAEALAEAETATSPRVELDLRDVPFVTLDPPGSRDLDQAFHLERATGRGGAAYIVRYAIADVPGVVRPGGALDAEVRTRGQTLYLPDGSVPLHPPILSEGRASLLAGEDRTAYVWTVSLDETGAQLDARVERAVIRSRAQLDYPSAQITIEQGEAEGALALLAEVGRLRIEQERLRGGASLNMPDEEIVRDPSGYRIVRRFPLPVEEWNAQLSLLTGMVAGSMMIDGGIGILRTMPAPEATALHEFRARVAALGLPWAEGMPYGEYLRRAPRNTAQGAAVLHAASGLFRGADYTPFTGRAPEQAEQAAIAAPYAHVTAPLRRLVDRWGLVICAALCADHPVPAWVLESLDELPVLMRASSARAGQLDSAALDRVEAALLRDRVGETFDAVVLEVRGERARVQITEPPVTAQCRLPEDTAYGAGTAIRVRVVRAEIATGTIELATA
ncbi:MAG: RNB domain-containing ribonuclease [Actinobacteria bacterium]|nr:RNB domain-containing ribonuclease [Actinomycetota bacterium]